MAEIAGEMPAVALSDDPDASSHIKAFTHSPRRWLVACDMVSEGVDIPRLLDMDNALLNNDKVADLIAGGYLRQSNRALGATDAGRMVLNAIIRDITNG